MVDVVVVGAGIVGAAIAYEVARAGAAVALVDRSVPASGVTGDSFAWIGGPSGVDAPDGSTPLRRSVLADYRRLERDVPGVRVRWTGSLTWDEEGPTDSRCLGQDEHLVDAAHVRRLEPNLLVPPVRALYKESDGAVDPVAVTEALVRAARAHGAQLAVGTAVTALRVRDGRVVGVETSSGFITARTVVVAAGVDTPMLCGPLGFDLPVAASPALLLRFTAAPGLVRTLVASPQIEVRETTPGHLLAAVGYTGEIGQEDLTGTGRETLRRLAATFAGAEDARLLDVRLGVRPMPADGLPIIGPLPGVDGAYVAVTHSGVTLAPTVGRCVAAEVVDGVEVAQLRGVRPARFRDDATD
ncbi:NAD(P)/FAD-dependent oxidoreductase [Micromonospora sp. GCM10011542]|uniref:NAD(P)/FAD-dependent oxidoreductase n=1 Tax=Micromonospora sp. GCM10011542 TaxID=3317337 RepID=UPI003606B6D0